ncbi:MAG: hypothetical protein LBS15_00645 [Endomicrobium sp.]|jgi:hypothetical protein|nr:hypothetical protein [Endomicrobium sp.]
MVGERKVIKASNSGSNNSKSITFRHLTKQYGRAVGQDIKNCVEANIKLGLISEAEREDEEVAMLSERLDILLEKCRDNDVYDDVKPEKKSASKKSVRNSSKKMHGNII